MICSLMRSTWRIISRDGTFVQLPRLVALTLVGMEFIAVFGAGLVAGLALAVPLGAIGVLLIHEGTLRGWAGGAPAALAVATVDLLYCTTAVAAGAAFAPVIATWAPWPGITGGTALVALAAWNLVRTRRSIVEARPSDDASHTRSSHRYLLFFGLTAINPATLVYFAAIVTGLSTLSTSTVAAALFVAGVALASLSWQLLLVLAGAILRWRAGARFRHLTTLIGHGVVGMLGVLMITGVIF